MLTTTFHLDDAYVLHDHLEAVTAAGYQMRTASLEFDMGDGSHTALLGRLRRITEFAQSMHALEMSILLKVSKAREWCQKLGQREYRLTPVIPLFIGTTGLVDDKIAEVGNLGQQQFHGEDDTLNYLTTRGFLLEGTGSLDTVEKIGPCETIHLLGELPLSPLAETCRTFSDVVDTYFKLYGSLREDAEEVVGDGEAELSNEVITAPVAKEQVIDNFLESTDDGDARSGTHEKSVEEPAAGNSENSIKEQVVVLEAGEDSDGSDDPEGEDRGDVADDEGAEDDSAADGTAAEDLPLPARRPTLGERLASLET